ncbi:MAG: YgjV family protein [Candidatus Paceibacterota bacterium]
MLITFGITGLIAISIAVWIKNEKKQDILFAVGGACILVYSIGIKNVIFSVLQIIFITSALAELIKKRRQ